jgi:hypothetical protein
MAKAEKPKRKVAAKKKAAKPVARLVAKSKPKLKLVAKAKAKAAPKRKSAAKSPPKKLETQAGHEGPAGMIWRLLEARKKAKDQKMNSPFAPKPDSHSQSRSLDKHQSRFARFAGPRRRAS